MNSLKSTSCGDFTQYRSPIHEHSNISDMSKRSRAFRALYVCVIYTETSSMHTSLYNTFGGRPQPTTPSPASYPIPIAKQTARERSSSAPSPKQLQLARQPHIHNHKFRSNENQNSKAKQRKLTSLIQHPARNEANRQRHYNRRDPPRRRPVLLGQFPRSHSLFGRGLCARLFRAGAGTGA